MGLFASFGFVDSPVISLQTDGPTPSRMTPCPQVRNLRILGQMLLMVEFGVVELWHRYNSDELLPARCLSAYR